MATNRAALMTQCQLALGLTQKELGALLGKDRRTIQRWQAKGFMLLPDETATLANALRPAHPELADQLLALARETATPGPTPRDGAATAETIDAILRAAAAAGGASPEATRPAVTAAFVKAQEEGVEVRDVVAGLEPGGRRR